MNRPTVSFAGIVAAIALTVAPGPAASAATKYRNCAALNKTFPHGVGKPGARDKTSGKPVTNFKVDRATYSSNTHLDRDKDGIACEKR